MPDTHKIKIFISYARENGKDLARQLFHAFSERPGWSAWMDEKLHAEELVSLEVQQAIISADYVVVVLSQDVNRDNPPNFVQRELLFATQEEIGKKVFAAKAEPCYVPVIIAGVTCLPFFEGEFNTNFEQLCTKIETARKQPQPVTVTPVLDRRDRELAYLRDLARQYSAWGKVYTDLAAERRVMPEKPAPKIEDAEKMSVPTEMFEQVEMAYLQYKPAGYSPDDDVEKLPLETFTSLSDAIRKFPRLALIGDPGCGKTTTLRRITLDLANAAANEESGTAPLPIFVPLGAFNGGKLEDYLAASFGGMPFREYLPDKVVVLLDGLNETAPAHVALVAKWLEDNPRVHVVVTGRKLEYVERKLDLQRVDVKPLDIFRMRQFMTNWGLKTDAVDDLFWRLAGMLVSELWDVWKSAGDTFERFWTLEQASGTPFYSKSSLRQDQAYNAMRSAMIEQDRLPGLLGLVRNPFLLTQTIFIYSKRHTVPRSRGELFTLFVATLLEQRGKLAIIPKQREWIEPAVQRGALAALAKWFQIERKQTFRTIPEVLDVFKAYIGRGPEKPDDLLIFAISAKLIEKSKETVRFSHQLLQEYFAAYGMQTDIENGISAAKYFPGDQWWEQTGWEESAQLLCGLHVSGEQVSPEAWRVVEWLTPVQPILAWRCITENGLDESHPTVQALKEPRAGVRAAPFARAKWGIEVADIDTRPGVLNFNFKMGDYWLPVPKGTYNLGSDEDKDNLKHTFEVMGDLYIAKYVITYKQFQAFIDDKKNGYSNVQWWAGLHQDGKDQQAKGPAEQSFKFWNHPRGNVSWYEAMAFCRWLSAKLGANIRLPTDDEWEAAARGTDQRRYPYGPDFDATKGNTDETGIGQTTAVGIFPDGISPCGALDMSGNVWEWTLDEYRSRSSTNLASNETRSMRGGAWRLDSDHARAAYRDGHLFPFTQYSGIGFRMVLVGMSPFSNVLLPAKENARTAPRYRAMYRLPGYP